VSIHPTQSRLVGDVVAISIGEGAEWSGSVCSWHYPKSASLAGQSPLLSEKADVADPRREMACGGVGRGGKADFASPSATRRATRGGEAAPQCRLVALVSMNLCPAGRSVAGLFFARSTATLPSHVLRPRWTSTNAGWDESANWDDGQGGYGKVARLRCRHLVCFFTSCGIDSFGRSTPTAR